MARVAVAPQSCVGAFEGRLDSRNYLGFGTILLSSSVPVAVQQERWSEVGPFYSEALYSKCTNDTQPKKGSNDGFWSGSDRDSDFTSNQT